MPGWWLTDCKVDLGESSLRAKWDFLSPRAVHLSFSYSTKAIIKNRNSNRDMLSPRLTPTMNLMDVSTLLMVSLTMFFTYIGLIYEHCLGHIFLVWR